MASALTREFVAVAGRLKGAGYITAADIVNKPWTDFSSEASTAIAPPLQRFFVWSAARFQFRGDREVWHSQRGKMPAWFLYEMRFGDYLAECDALDEAARASLKLAAGPEYTMAQLSVCPKTTFVALSGLAPEAAAAFWDAAQAVCDECAPLPSTP